MASMLVYFGWQCRRRTQSAISEHVFHATVAIARATAVVEHLIHLEHLSVLALVGSAEHTKGTHAHVVTVAVLAPITATAAVHGIHGEHGVHVQLRRGSTNQQSNDSDEFHLKV
jgi:hypothetical protein